MGQKLASLLCSSNKCAALKGQEPVLGLQAACIAGQAAVGANHSMTGEKEGQRVGSDGGGHRSDGAGLIQAGRQCPVSPDLSVRDPGEGLPDVALEGRPGGPQGKVEITSRADEILIELGTGLGQQRVPALGKLRRKGSLKATVDLLAKAPVGPVA